MPIVKMTLAQAKPLTAAQRAHFAALATKPDSAIDFSDQPEITDADIASGRVRIIGRGGARPGAGRKATGNRAVQLRLPFALLRSLRAEARRQGTTLSAVAAARLAVP